MLMSKKLKPGQPGAKRLVGQSGQRLVCVRYRYDASQHKQFKTVELIVEESAWTPPAAPMTEPIMVGLRVGINEIAIQRQIKQAGGKGNRQLQVWEILSDQTIALGLKDRIQNLEVSTNRHQPVTGMQTAEVSTTRHPCLLIDMGV